MNKAERNPLTPAEREFVERFGDHYVPTPRTASARVAFNDALRARMSRRRIQLWQPLAAAACAAAFALWFVLPGWLATSETPPEVAGQASGEVLLALALDEEEMAQADDLLPEDYATLASIFDL